MQPFGAGFGGFGGQSLRGVGFEIFAGFLFLLDALANAFAGGDHEEDDVIAARFLRDRERNR